MTSGTPFCRPNRAELADGPRRVLKELPLPLIYNIYRKAIFYKSVPFRARQYKIRGFGCLDYQLGSSRRHACSQGSQIQQMREPYKKCLKN
jgi:hypothetical protein